MAGGEATHLTADAGVYDSVGERMELSENIRIKNGRFTVLLRSAKFDFKSGVYGSDEPVEVQAGDGTTMFADRGCGAQPRSGADFRRPRQDEHRSADRTNSRRPR